MNTDETSKRIKGLILTSLCDNDTVDLKGNTSLPRYVKIPADIDLLPKAIRAFVDGVQGATRVTIIKPGETCVLEHGNFSEPVRYVTLFRSGDESSDCLDPASIAKEVCVTKKPIRDLMTVNMSHGNYNASCKILLGENIIYTVPAPVNLSSSLVFDDERVTMIPPIRRGGRPMQITKNINNRVIVIVDQSLLLPNKKSTDA